MSSIQSLYQELAATFCQDDKELSCGVRVEVNWQQQLGLEHGGLKKSTLEAQAQILIDTNVNIDRHIIL